MTGGRGGGSRRTSLNVCSQDDSDLDRKSFGTKKKKKNSRNYCVFSLSATPVLSCWGRCS